MCTIRMTSKVTLQIGLSETTSVSEAVLKNMYDTFTNCRYGHHYVNVSSKDGVRRRKRRWRKRRWRKRSWRKSLTGN